HAAPGHAFAVDGGAAYGGVQHIEPGVCRVGADAEQAADGAIATDVEVRAGLRGGSVLNEVASDVGVERSRDRQISTNDAVSCNVEVRAWLLRRGILNVIAAP